MPRTIKSKDHPLTGYLKCPKCSGKMDWGDFNGMTWVNHCGKCSYIAPKECPHCTLNRRKTNLKWSKSGPLDLLSWNCPKCRWRDVAHVCLDYSCPVCEGRGTLDYDERAIYCTCNIIGKSNDDGECLFCAGQQKITCQEQILPGQLIRCRQCGFNNDRFCFDLASMKWLSVESSEGERAKRARAYAESIRWIRRDPATLTRDDWDFRSILDETDAQMQLAACHYEHLRECVRIRSACYIFTSSPFYSVARRLRHGPPHPALSEQEQRWLCLLLYGDPHGVELEYPEKVEERAMLADNIKPQLTHEERTLLRAYNKAQQFLGKLHAVGPFLALTDPRGDLAEGIARDVAWKTIQADATIMARLLKSDWPLGKESKRDIPPPGAAMLADLEKSAFATQSPWMLPGYGDAKYGTEKFSGEWAGHNRNTHKQGRLYGFRTILRKGKEAICEEQFAAKICWNYTDDEIIGQFAEWVMNKRVKLEEPWISYAELKHGEGKGGPRFKPDRIAAALKSLAALRMRARYRAKDEPLKNTADDFSAIYLSKTNVANLKHQADAARDFFDEFLPECNADSMTDRKL